MSNQAMTLIWPIIYNGILIFLTIILLTHIKRRNTKKLLLISMISLLMLIILSIITLFINLYVSRDSETAQNLTALENLGVYSLPTFFLIFAFLSTLYRDRHNFLAFQRLRFTFITISTFVIYTSVFYAITN